MDELYLFVYGQPIGLAELVAMVDGARKLSRAALVEGVRPAVEEGQLVFQAAKHPSPQQHKAIVCAHLLRHCMNEIDALKETLVQTPPPEPSPRAPDASPAAPAKSAPAAVAPAPPPSSVCPGGHPSDIFCELCEDAWNARRARQAAPASAGGP